jgi:hypothetical protein
MFERAGPPDRRMKPIENIWAILKGRLEELEPEITEELIDMIIMAWKGIEMSLVNKPVNWTPNDVRRR